jgi:tetratricopeptide (TPR) repeat protein
MLVALVSSAQGQTPESYDLERQRAFQLFDEHKLIDALPLLEKLAVAKPDDRVVLERLSFALAAKSVGLADAAERRKLRIRAREVMLQSKKLGNNSNLMQTLLDSIPEDGSEGSFSNRKDVEDAMREGEAAYTRGDLDNAVVAYKRALLLDPKLYTAPLFIGDVYYKKGDTAKAAEWYAQAINIDPNHETAYRYWGDLLIKEGKMDEARIKFLEAIVAEPYNRAAYAGLGQWAERQQVRLAHPQIQPAGGVSTEGGKTNITVDPKSLGAKDGSQHWMLYGLSRATWPAGRFAKEYPNEKTYRHSLGEEADALRMVAEAAAKDIKDGKLKPVDPQIAALVKLNEAGLLEAYILFARPDAGIAQDYAAYRAKNRDKLMRYLTEYVAPAK